MKVNVLRKWWLAATPEEKVLLADKAKSSYNAINQASMASRTEGKLQLTPEYARRIEIAARSLHRAGLPVLLREEMCPACGKCEFAKECRG